MWKKAEPVDPELDGGAVPVVEKQLGKDDAAVMEADTDAILATGGQHQQKLPVGDRAELPTQVSNMNDTSAAELDATPAQSIPAHHAAELPLNTPLHLALAELPPNTPLLPAPAELHAAAAPSPYVPAVPGPSQSQSPSQTVSNGMDSEIAQLLERKARVDERRRALELEQLGAEASAIESRLSQLSQLQGRGSPQAREGR